MTSKPKMGRPLIDPSGEPLAQVKYGMTHKLLSLVAWWRKQRGLRTQQDAHRDLLDAAAREKHKLLTQTEALEEDVSEEQMKRIYADDDNLQRAIDGLAEINRARKEEDK